MCAAWSEHPPGYGVCIEHGGIPDRIHHASFNLVNSVSRDRAKHCLDGSQAVLHSTSAVATSPLFGGWSHEGPTPRIACVAPTTSPSCGVVTSDSPTGLISCTACLSTVSRGVSVRCWPTRPYQDTPNRMHRIPTHPLWLPAQRRQLMDPSDDAGHITWSILPWMILSSRVVSWPLVAPQQQERGSFATGLVIGPTILMARADAIAPRPLHPGTGVGTIVGIRYARRLVSGESPALPRSRPCEPFPIVSDLVVHPGPRAAPPGTKRTIPVHIGTPRVVQVPSGPTRALPLVAT